MTEREIVYNKFYGECAYCGCKIRLNKKASGKMLPVMQIDHFEPLQRTVDKSEEETARLEHIDNKMPACPTCNLFKTTYDIEMFRKCLEDQLRIELANCTRFKRMLKYGLIEVVEKPVVFYFERIIRKD